MNLVNLCITEKEQLKYNMGLVRRNWGGISGNLRSKRIEITTKTLISEVIY